MSGRGALRAFAVVCVAFGLGLGGVAAAEAEPMVVVVNEGVPADRLTPLEVRAIYLGDVESIGAVTLEPIDYVAGAEARAPFLEGVLRMPDDTFRGHWARLMFRNGRRPPREAASPGEVLAEVAARPGAVGYVPEAVLERSGFRSLHVVCRFGG